MCFFHLAKRENRVDVKKLNAVVPDPGPPRPEGASSKALEDLGHAIYSGRTSRALRSLQGELDELDELDDAVFLEIVEKAEESVTLPGAVEHVAPPSNAPAEEDLCGKSIYAMLCEEHSDY